MSTTNTSPVATCCLLKRQAFKLISLPFDPVKILSCYFVGLKAAIVCGVPLKCRENLVLLRFNFHSVVSSFGYQLHMFCTWWGAKTQSVLASYVNFSSYEFILSP